MYSTRGEAILYNLKFSQAYYWVLYCTTYEDGSELPNNSSVVIDFDATCLRRVLTALMF